MSLTLSVEHSIARLQATLTFANLGAGNSVIQFYSTAQPANGAAPGGLPVATATLAKPCGVIAGGVLTLGLR